MKKILLTLIASSILLFATENIQLQSGWQMVGSSLEIKNMEGFNDSRIKTVWAYDNQNKSWKAYSPDSTTMGVITNSSSIGSLTSIKENEGFWVNAESTYIITVDENTTVDYNLTRSIFVDPFIDVTLPMVAGKTFKYEKHDMHSSSAPTFETITFDSSGVATHVIAISACDYHYADKNVTSITTQMKVESGSLNYYVDGNFTTSYKLLASNTTGAVFGALDANTYTYSPYSPGEIFYVLENSAIENPINMQGLSYPMDVYSSYSPVGYYSTFEANSTITQHYLSGSNNGQNYTFGDNKINIDSTYNATSYGYTSSSKIQNVYSIGRYNLSRESWSSSNWNSHISYYNADKTQYLDLNLTQENITTWSGLFSKTNNNYYSSTYYDANKTTSDGSTYNISADDKVLNVISIDGCYTMTYTLDNSNKITTSYDGSYLSLSSLTAIKNSNSTSYATRILNKTLDKSKPEIKGLFFNVLSVPTWNSK